jgi:hypothetical protein
MKKAGRPILRAAGRFEGPSHPCGPDPRRQRTSVTPARGRPQRRQYRFQNSLRQGWTSTPTFLAAYRGPSMARVGTADAEV